MNEFFSQLLAHVLAFWHAIGESGKHVVVMVLASAATGLATWIGIKWRSYMYGKIVHVHISWLEVEGDASVLQSKILWSGPALQLLHRKSVSRTLVRASRWKKGFLDKGSWNQQKAERTLNVIANHVSRQFAAGAIGRAMGDKDVTKGTFWIGAYNEGSEISINLVNGPDLERISEAHLMKRITGGETLDECLAMAGNACCIPDRRMTTVDLYM